MNGIDDEFIEEALTYERSKKRKPSCVLRIVLVAALISVLLFTSALAFSPSLRENTLNVLVEIFSDHATFCVEGEEPAGSYIAGKIDYSALEETYRLDPGGCYRADFASGATFFGNNGEIISITVVAIRDGLHSCATVLFATVQTCVRSTSRAMHRSKPIMYLIPPKMSPCIIRTGPTAGRIPGTDVLRKYISPNKKCKGHAQI